MLVLAVMARMRAQWMCSSSIRSALVPIVGNMSRFCSFAVLQVANSAAKMNTLGKQSLCIKELFETPSVPELARATMNIK